ncbi:hypothetical protein MJH12_02975, partial [bacterium]|nr:hypothetical protein [bacterium]
KGIELSGELSNQFLYRRGSVAFFSHDYQDCLQYLSDSLKLNNMHYDALILQAKVFVRLDEKEKAIDSYEKALSLDSEDSKVMMEIAKLWEDLGYLKNSREIWKEVLDLKNKDIYWEIASEKLRFYENTI